MTITGSIEVTCSDSIVISPPDILTTDKLSYTKGLVPKIITIGNFTTDDNNCPIVSY